MTPLSSPAAFHELVGKDARHSEWITVDQAMVDDFARVTGDMQWIHVDVARAKAESPYGGTIAHGFLTLSLLSRLYASTFSFPNRRSGVNYGFDKLRFVSPVKTGDRIRASFGLQSVRDISGTDVEAHWTAHVLVEGAQRPAVAAHWILRCSY